MATWRFDLVMEHLPLMLQAAPPIIVMFSLTTPTSLIELFLASPSVSLHSVSSCLPIVLAITAPQPKPTFRLRGLGVLMGHNCLGG